jgi:ABC-type branched-subunit amino acid transport system substrate-binding protein
MTVQKMLKQQNPDMIYFAGNALDANGMLEGLQTPNAKKVVVMGGDALYEISGYKEKHYKNLFFTSFAFPDEWNVKGKDLDEWAWVPGSEGIGTSQNQHPFPDQYRLTFSGWPLKAYGYSRPDSDAILSFDGTAVLIHAMTIMRQENNSSDSLQAILTSEKFEGFSGQISFEPNSVAKQVVLLCVGSDGFTKEVLTVHTCV